MLGLRITRLATEIYFQMKGNPCFLILFPYINLAVQIPPILTPAIYNAIEGDSTSVQITCTSVEPVWSFIFDVGGNLYMSDYNTYNNFLFVNTTAVVLTVPPLPIKNSSNITVTCIAIFSTNSLNSTPGQLLLHPRLPFPTGLSIMDSTTTNFKLLSWEHPVMMNVTDNELLDIIGYRVCFGFSDQSVLEQCVVTPNNYYTYINVHLILYISVASVNMLGDGYASEITHLPCTARTFSP